MVSAKQPVCTPQKASASPRTCPRIIEIVDSEEKNSFLPSRRNDRGGLWTL